MSTHRKTLFTVILIAALLLGSFPGTAGAVTQEDINAARARRDAIASRRAALQAEVDSLARQQAGVLEQKNAMDARSTATLELMEQTREELRLCAELLEQAGREAAAAAEQESLQRERYRTRVRAMEENGSLGLLSLILHTETLGEFFTAADDIGEIMRYDRALEESWRLAREKSEQARAEQVRVQNELMARQNALEAEQLQLAGEIREAEDLIASLQNEIDSGSADAAAVQAAEDAAESELQSLMAELERQRRAEEERRRLEEERRRQAELEREREEAARQAEADRRAIEAHPPSLATEQNATGSFVWPVPGHTTVTSRFGLRTHPVTGVEKKHLGLDIAADTGTDIVAADGGVVTRASVYGGYGNCVILDHQNGYVTLYGHLSRYAVREGDSVRQGQVIGQVGSTGLTTGPHCHFEIWQSGTRIDPEAFFTGLNLED